MRGGDRLFAFKRPKNKEQTLDLSNSVSSFHVQDSLIYKRRYIDAYNHKYKRIHTHTNTNARTLTVTQAAIHLNCYSANMHLNINPGIFQKLSHLYGDIG